MSRQLTKKQKEFADGFLETGNGTQTALKTYDTESYMTAANIASENLNKPKVQEYIESRAEHAAEIVYELAQDADEDKVRLGAAKDILDRSGFKPIERMARVNMNITQGFSTSDPKMIEVAREYEAKLKEML